MAMSSLSQRGLRPVQELAADRGHGDRLKYLAGCRCLQCRAANANYETHRAAARRAGDWNGLVPAGRARRHILKLSRKGIGRRAIAEAADIPQSIIAKIKKPATKHIRKKTESKILAVTDGAVSGGAIVPAKRTWKLIRRLLDEGFTKAELARRLGCKSHHLQISKERILAQTAVRVERLFNRLMS
jgi:hypothetical protein